MMIKATARRNVRSEPRIRAKIVEASLIADYDDCDDHDESNLQ
jgi:hypothetical protein